MSSADNFFNSSVRNQLGKDFSKLSNQRNFKNSTLEEGSIEDDVDITGDHVQVSGVQSLILFFVVLSCSGINIAFYYF